MGVGERPRSRGPGPAARSRDMGPLRVLDAAVPHADGRGRGPLRRDAGRLAHPGAPRRWTFDDHVRLDVPAALAAVRAATGAAAVHWVGHSQGGLIGMAASAAFPERVASLVALGA